MILSDWKLFRRKDEPLSFLQTILWWEFRRLPYNVIVGIAGILSIAMAILASIIAWTFFHFEYAVPDPPFFAIVVVILYGVLANICYTGGWIAEILARKIWEEKAKGFGEISFALGTVFSVGLTMLPGLLLLLLLPFAVVMGREGRQLHEAIKRGDAAQVKRIVANTPRNIESRTTNKFALTPLCDALESEKWEIARFLLDAGADVRPDCFGRSMRSLAEHSKDAELISAIARKAEGVRPSKQ